MASVPAAVARFLLANKLPMTAVVWPELEKADWKGAGITAEARKAEGRDLVGITGIHCAIAETGTMLLLSGERTPGSTSLLPETHIAIVPVARVVKGMEDALALVQLLAKDRPAIALARDSALDRHLTVAAAIALGTLAWDLWKEREQTAPHLALERFADLNARVDYSDDLVTVSLPLGKRFLDLRDHGLLDDVHDVPWLDGRKLIFTSG